MNGLIWVEMDIQGVKDDKHAFCSAVHFPAITYLAAFFIAAIATPVISDCKSTELRDDTKAG